MRRSVWCNQLHSRPKRTWHPLRAAGAGSDYRVRNVILPSLFPFYTPTLSIPVLHEAQTAASFFLIGCLIIPSPALLATQNGRVRSNRIHWTTGGVGSTVSCAHTLCRPHSRFQILLNEEASVS